VRAHTYSFAYADGYAYSNVNAHGDALSDAHVHTEHG